MAKAGMRQSIDWLYLFAFVLLLLLVPARAENAVPPKPARFFNDFAGVISPSTIERLNARLEAFERETSTQVLVALFKKVPDDYALEDFTQRTAEAWGIGKKANDNGVALFVFVESRRVRIEVGYGLEGALPDAVAKQIIDNEIVPAFRAGDFDAGLTRGVEAILRATRGEYRGTGGTRRQDGGNVSWIVVIILLFFAWRIFSALRRTSRGALYGPRGRRYIPMGGWPFWSGGGGWGGSGGGGSWGGGFGGGGGGFHGGGGGFGGGGASGSW